MHRRTNVLGCWARRTAATRGPRTRRGWPRVTEEGRLWLCRLSLGTNGDTGEECVVAEWGYRLGEDADGPWKTNPMLRHGHAAQAHRIGRGHLSSRIRHEGGKFGGESILESFAPVRKAPADMALSQLSTPIPVTPLGGWPCM